MSKKPKSNWQNKGAYSSPEYIKARAHVRIRDEGCCIRCRVLYGLITPGRECDHWIGVAREGTHELTNLWMLCKPCHRNKTQFELVDGRSGFQAQVDPKTGFDLVEPEWQEIIRERTVAYLRQF